MTVTEPGPERLAQRASVRRDDVLARAVDEAARLVDARGSLIFIRDPADGGGLRLTSVDTVRAEDARRWEAALRRPRHLEGILVRAMIEGRTLTSEDYPVDPAFSPEKAELRAVRSFGVRSVVAAPLVVDGVAAGVLSVYSDRPAAFTERDAAVLTMIADHAAATVANVRLIDELGRSRSELARRAENERVLREIAARFAAITDPAVLLQFVVDEANRLVDGDGAVLDVVQPGTRMLAWAYDSGLSAQFSEEEVAGYTLPIGRGLTGRAVEERRVLVAGDDLVTQFPPSAESDRFFELTRFRSMIAAPIGTEARPLGALEVYSARPNAFDADDAALVGALADHAAIALITARQMADLTESRGEIARRAEAERSLREIAARISALHDPAAILEQTAAAAGRLVLADGATIDLFDPIGESSGFWYGVGATRNQTSPATSLDIDTAKAIGISGLALAEDRPVATGDYLADPTFTHEPSRDAFIEAEGVHSVMAAPLATEDGPVGVINVHALRPNAFGPDELRIIGAIADLATIAVTNARLLERVHRTADELARRADVERALREIAIRLAGIRDPSEILQLTVDEAVRILRADGAVLDLVDPERGVLRGAYDAAMADRVDEDRLRSQELELSKGVSGLALTMRRVIVTGDYLPDERFEHDPAADDFIRAAGVRSMVAAPLIGEEGPVGVIEVYAERADAFDEASASILEAFAGQATVAITNARLNERLEASEEQYRILLTSSPDLIWSAGADGRFTFVSDASREMLGWDPDDLIGHHFSEVVAPGSRAVATERWEGIVANPTRRQFVPLELIRPDGTIIPTEITAIGLVTDGRLVGVQGATRDVRVRERLERELRRQSAEIAASEERAHLARELHDSVTQALFSMTLISRSVELLLERDPAQAAEKLETLRELQRDALAEMRALIFELRPGSLERDGLVQALRTHAAAVEGRTGLSIVVDCTDLPDRLSLEAEDVLYRIGQEALHNVVKHAGATEARVVVVAANGSATLTVEDDGEGFDPTTIGAGHLGIEGMRTRAERSGGRLLVDAAPGEGTKVTAILPIGRT